MLELREIVATDHIAEAWILLEDHRLELATNKGLMVLNPDIATYLRLEENQSMLSLGAYDGNEIVGYSVSIVHCNLHYADVIMCQNDVLFLKESYRTGANGLRLIRETERLARERGCHMMLWHAKMDTTFMAILHKLGYGVQDIIYSKAL